MKFQVLTAIFFSISLSTVIEAGGVNLEYLDEAKLKKLRTQFDQAERVDLSKLSSLNESKWNCEMYGMSSRLQVEKDIKLYYFKATKKDGKIDGFDNKGAQVVHSYRAGEELKGLQGSFQDQIRLSKGGQLISKLEAGTRLLAISICDRLSL